MPLSDIAIRKAKAADKPYKLADGGGLYVLVNPNGSKWWRWDYRHGGKRKTLSMGTYPDTFLTAARDRHAEARKLLAAGVDPAEQRKAAKVAAGVPPVTRVQHQPIGDLSCCREVVANAGHR